MKIIETRLRPNPDGTAAARGTASVDFGDCRVIVIMLEKQPGEMVALFPPRVRLRETYEAAQAALVAAFNEQQGTNYKPARQAAVEPVDDLADGRRVVRADVAETMRIAGLEAA